MGLPLCFKLSGGHRCTGLMVKEDLRDPEGLQEKVHDLPCGGTQAAKDTATRELGNSVSAVDGSARC